MSAAGFYHCSVKGVGRAKGRSVVAAAAYRAGERLTDEITGLVQDYQLRHGVLDSFILAPANAPSWAHDRERLWNAAERAEARANGRLATEFELALPHELTDAQRKELVTDFLRPIIERHGVAADVAIHAPGQGSDHRNIHAHVLLTHRELDADGFGDIANTRTITRKRKGQEVQEQVAGIAATPADIRAIRQAWERDVNRAYEHAGLDIRVDHRSHEDRGIEQEPTKHLGPTATAMEKRGVASDRGDLNRDIVQRNVDRRLLKALDAEARKIAAAIIELEAGRPEAEQRHAASSRYDELRASQQDAIEAERRAGSETARVFTSAAARTTEPAAPIWDRDAANADWADKVAAAGIAKPETAPAPQPDARQRPAEAAGIETRRALDEPTAVPASEPVEALDLGSRAASGFGKRLAAMAESLWSGLFGFLVAEPKLTPGQVHDRAKAEGNEETLHARAYAAAEQEKEAAQDSRIYEQQRSRDIARTLNIEPVGDPEEDRFRSIMQRAARDRDRDRDYERER